MSTSSGKYKIITHESIVHSQVFALYRLLNRQIDYKITLNRQKLSSVIEFDADESEETLLKDELGFTVLKKDAAGWAPLA